MDYLGSSASRIGVLAVFCLVVTPAASRTWISGHGTDVPGCGAVGTPCRSPQYALDNIVVSNGEIDVLDAAGYGAVTITKAVSIINDGVGTAGLVATTGNAVTITVGATDKVVLRGLSIEGVDSGLYGIQMTSGGSLTITNCAVGHFA